MKNILNYIYPFLSIGILEFGNIINHANQILTFIVFLIQILIAFFTVQKLYYDIKSKKSKTIEQTESVIKRKHPILVYLLSFFNNLKK